MPSLAAVTAGVITTAIGGMLYIPITAYANMDTISANKAERMIKPMAAAIIDQHEKSKPLDFLANLANHSLDPRTATHSTAAIAMIKEKEGFRSKPYYIAGENSHTIGYGSRYDAQNKPVTARTAAVDETQAVALVQAHMQRNVTPYIQRCITARVSQDMWDAISVWTYNVGGWAACDSVLIAKLNKGDIYGAYKEFDRWAYAQGVYKKGLATRRSEEKAKFMASVKRAATLTVK